MPRDRHLDATGAFKRDPYRFIARRADEVGSDVFTTRLLGRETICLTGPEAARLFYDADRFERAGAAPAALQKTLFGRGGVQGLDGAEHAHRKQLFLSIVSPERVGQLGEEVLRALRHAAEGWGRLGHIELYAELHPVLTRAVCAWAGVPLPPEAVARRTRQLRALFDQAGALGVGHLYARYARRSSERWAAGLVDAVRCGRLRVRQGSALHRIAWHRGLDGRALPPRIAAVELLNVLRPTVAVSVFLVFAAHALHVHPAEAEILRAGRPGELACFVQEVRRAYPFFPAAAARVRRDFRWHGYDFRAGTRTLLDLYGIDHDRRIWGADADAFRPARFRERDPGPFAFVPQGGGDVRTGHRCPGEGIAFELMSRGVRFLQREIEYSVPEQDLEVDFTRLPALPRGRFVVSDVRRAKAEPVRLERRRTRPLRAV
jgi:fatty-acid peroxygenase